MWFFIGATGLGALITGGLALGGLGRLLVLRCLPIVTPVGFAGTEPGTAVILTGRTAADPYRQTHHVSLYHHTGEGSSETVTEYPATGDSRLHGDDGAATDVDVEILRKPLFPGRPAIVTATGGPREVNPERGSTEHFNREFAAPAGRLAHAVGKVGAGRLEANAVLGGSALGDLADLGRRDRIRSAWLAALAALLLVAVFILLIR